MTAFLLAAAGVLLAATGTARMLRRKPGQPTTRANCLTAVGLLLDGASSILDGTFWLTGTCGFLLLAGIALMVASARSRHRNARSS